MAPLSTLLSHALVAFTIELDNEFEERFADSGQRARVTSFVMWANFLRFVGDGIAVAELPAAAGIPRARTLSTLGGMERWGYVSVGPDPETTARRLRERARSSSGLGRSPNPRRRGRGCDLARRWPTRSRGAGRSGSGLPRSRSFGSVWNRSPGTSTSRCRSTCRSSAARTGGSTTRSSDGDAKPSRGRRCPRSCPVRSLPTRSSSSAGRSSPCRSAPTLCASSTRAV